MVGLSSEVLAAPSLAMNVSATTYDEEVGNISLSMLGTGDKEEIEGLPSFHSFTGQSDPIYCEAKLTHGKFALLLEVTVLNRT